MAQRDARACPSMACNAGIRGGGVQIAVEGGGAPAPDEWASGRLTTQSTPVSPGRSVAESVDARQSDVLPAMTPGCAWQRWVVLWYRHVASSATNVLLNDSRRGEPQSR